MGLGGKLQGDVPGTIKKPLRRGVLDIVRDYTATFDRPDYGPIYTAEAKLREDPGSYASCVQAYIDNCLTRGHEHDGDLGADVLSGDRASLRRRRVSKRRAVRAQRSAPNAPLETTETVSIGAVVEV